MGKINKILKRNISGAFNKWKNTDPNAIVRKWITLSYTHFIPSERA